MFISLFFIVFIVRGNGFVYHNDKKMSRVLLYNNSIGEGNEITPKVAEIVDLNKEILSETPMTNIMTKFIVGYSIRKKIFDEVANNDDMIKTIDHFNPLYVFLLLMSSVSAVSDMRYRNRIPKLQIETKNPTIYRWVDGILLIIVITLMKNVKNAI